MKKLIKTLAFILCLVLTPSTFLLTGCGKKSLRRQTLENAENSDINQTSDNESESTYRIEIKYDYSKDVFVSQTTLTPVYGAENQSLSGIKEFALQVPIEETDESENVENVNNLPSSISVTDGIVSGLPDVVSAYQNNFLGWYVVGTDKRVRNNDVVTENMTVEARFTDEGTSPVKNGVYYYVGNGDSTMQAISLIFQGDKVLYSAYYEPGIIRNKEEGLAWAHYVQDGTSLTYKFEGESEFMGEFSIEILDRVNSTTFAIPNDGPDGTIYFRLMGNDEQLITLGRSLLRECQSVEHEGYSYKIIPGEIDSNGIQTIYLEKYEGATKDESFGRQELRCATAGFGIEIEIEAFQRSPLKMHYWYGYYRMLKVTEGEHTGKTQVTLYLDHEVNKSIDPYQYPTPVEGRIFTYYI